MLRGNVRNLGSTVLNKNCTYPSSPTKCVCPQACLEQVENTNYCKMKKCYTWDENLGKCDESGKDFVAPLVLQAIPFTGIFGSGFGNIGRWDIFGLYMGVLFGGCCSILIFMFALLACCPADEGQDKETTLACLGYCGGLIWALGVLTLYVLGIYWTASPGAILDSAGCPLKFH